MKKIKWHLLIIATLGICAGYVNKPSRTNHRTHQTMDTYQYAYSVPGKTYYGADLTSLGATLGIDYDCTQNSSICTFIANPASAHADGGGSFFYNSDIPNSGIIYGTLTWF